MLKQIYTSWQPHTKRSVYYLNVFLKKKKGRKAYESTSSSCFASTFCQHHTHQEQHFLPARARSIPCGSHCWSQLSALLQHQPDHTFREGLTHWRHLLTHWPSGAFSAKVKPASQIHVTQESNLCQWSHFVIAAVQRSWEATRGTGKWPRSEASLGCNCHVPAVTNQLVLAQSASTGCGWTPDKIQ